jgi:hypothetical protein
MTMFVGPAFLTGCWILVWFLKSIYTMIANTSTRLWKIRTYIFNAIRKCEVTSDLFKNIDIGTVRRDIHTVILQWITDTLYDTSPYLYLKTFVYYLTWTHYSEYLLPAWGNLNQILATSCSLFTFWRRPGVPTSAYWNTHLVVLRKD